MAKGISAISPKVDPNLRKPLEQIRELIEVGTGQNRGSNLDQWITYRGLLDMGLAKLVGNPLTIYPGANIIPGVAAPNPITPPAPKNFTVTSGFSHIFLEWDVPTRQYQGHAYTTIYRSVSDDIGTAEAVAQTTSMVFADLNVVREQVYYYWARFTSESGIEGPPNAAAGTPGQTAPDPALVLASLTNQITETQLYQDLQTRINLIDVTNGGLVNNLATETSARQTAINSLQQQIDGLVVATDVEIFYQATEPTNAQANGGTLVEGSRWFDTDDNNHPYVYNDGAWKDARDQLVISVQANLASEITARTTADSAQVARLNALEATVNNPTTGMAANTTAIGGLTSSVTTINNEIDGIQSDITAQAADITSLEATVFNGSTGVGANAAALAGLQTTVTTQGNNITSLTSQVSGLISTVNNPSTGVSATAAALSTLQTTVSQIDGEVSAATTAVSTLQSTVGDNTSAIEVAQQAIDGVEAQYTVKVDVNGYVAGYGLAITQNEYTGASHSEMIFSVDRFSIGAPGKNHLAFIVDGDRVVMDGALIKNATINTAQIGSIAVDKISGITSSFILSNIGTGNITNAYIGDYIQSDTYASSGGANGWYIAKDGTAIFNNVYARGNIEATRIKGAIIEAEHLVGGSVSYMNSTQSSGLSVNAGQTKFVHSIDPQIPSGLTGDVMIMVAFRGQADPNNATNIGVKVYGRLANGSRTAKLHEAGISVQKGYVEAGFTTYIWRNVASGSTIEIDLFDSWNVGYIISGVVNTNILRTLY